MRWAFALIASLAGLVGPDKPSKAPSAEPFGLIIACKKGGVDNAESHLASGYQCVGHDSHGSAFSAGSISVYNDDVSPGP